MHEIDELSLEKYEEHLRALDHNLLAAMQNNGYTSARVVKLLAHIDGDNGGPNWHWIVSLTNGSFAYITGGCDYTGWDYRSDLDIFEESTLADVLRQVGEVERPILAAQITDV